MIAPNVPNIFSGLVSQLKHSAIASLTTAAGKAAATARSSLPTPTAAMREVLSHYNMTAITPNDFSKLIQQLSAKGTISQQDAQQLSSIRVDLENAGVNADESVNLLDFYKQQIANVQGAVAQSSSPGAAKSTMNALVGRLNWLQRFAVVNQQGGQNGLNAEA